MILLGCDLLLFSYLCKVLDNDTVNEGIEMVL